VVERNWAGNIDYRAPFIARPESLAELQDLVARSPRLRVVGTRHSFNDIADRDTLVSVDGLPDDVVIDSTAGTVAVNAAMTYGRLAATLNAHDLAVHNLASLPHISLAGAIATATHGSGDRLGNLATAVSSIDLIRSDGELLHIDRNDRDFDGVVVNLGSLGAVVRVELDVEPAYHVAQYVFEGLPWEALAANFDALTAAGDSVSSFTTYAGPYVEQVWVKRRLGRHEHALDVTAGLFGARPASVDLHPISAMSAENCTAQLGVPGSWSDRLPHFRMGFTPSAGDELQSELFVARADALSAIEVLRRLAEELAPMLLISEIRTVAADSLWMSPHYQRDTVAFHFTWRRDMERATHLVRRVESALSEHAPRPHWAKLFTLESTTVAERYPRHADFLDLLERFDPRHAFRNAWLERVILGG
jgi:alditol oxidase